MRYFTSIDRTLYQFGNSTINTVFTDISRYVNLIDELKDNIVTYTKYHILEGDRPDTLSIKLYGTPLYYWTFFLMNDHVRLNGWPLTHYDLDAKVKREFPNTTIVSRNSLTGIMRIGQTVTGAATGTSGKIIHRDTNFGHLVVEGAKVFSDGEAITSPNSSGGTDTCTVASASEEYNAIHHYEDASGDWKDADPAVGNPGSYVEITNYNRWYKQNEDLKIINIIRPNIIEEVVGAYKKAISE